MNYLKTIAASYVISFLLLVIFMYFDLRLGMSYFSSGSWYSWLLLTIAPIYFFFVWPTIQVKLFFTFARKFGFRFFPGPLFWLIATTGLSLTLYFGVYLSTHVFGDVRYHAGIPEFSMYVTPKNIAITFGTVFSLYAMAVYLSIARSIKE